MNPTIRISALALTAMLVSTAAHAEQRWPNWYIGLTGAAGFLQDSDVKGSGIGTTRGFDYDPVGWGVGASVGYLPSTSIAPFNYMRFEGEVFYHTNEIDNRRTTGAPAASSGAVSATSYMANAYYDMPTGMSFYPYIGAGIGVSTIALSKGAGLPITNDTDTRMSYQGMVGLAFTPSSIPDTELTLGYRYLWSSRPSFSTGTGTANLDYQLSDIEAGMKFRF